MKLHEDGEFTALSWVKQALDATMAQARQNLEAYVENPADLEPMRSCVADLHQVQGSLRMVELYGAAMVAENMERLAEGLLDGSVRQRDESYSVLMRGMMQLPDYLERLQSGHRDIPLVLLPLLNDLRACRGENLLSESALFAPNLAAALPDAAAGRVEPLPPSELRAQALRLRLGFQAALLKWIRDEGSAEHLRRLMDVLDRLRRISSGAEARRLWWIAAAVIEAVENGGLEASVAVKLLFARVDREIHRFARDGEIGYATTPPRELTKNLLYYVAHSGDDGELPDGPRCAEVRRVYQLDTLLPTQAEMQHAEGSMAGRNRNLLGTVSAAIKEDLLRVKDALDLYLRTKPSDTSDLEAQVETLDRVGDTLGMLGLGVPRRVVSEQRDVVMQMVRGERAVDESELLDVAGALLYVEASLDDHIDRLGAEEGGAESARHDELELPQAEVRRILDVLMREAAVNLEQAKSDVIAFIEAPWDHARVEQIPRLLEEIAGAMRMLALQEPAELMAAAIRFVQVELLMHRRVPSAAQMDKLADTLAAIEYYLEASREQRRNRNRILDVARESLETLGYWPLPPLPEQEMAALAAASQPAAAGAPAAHAPARGPAMAAAEPATPSRAESVAEPQAPPEPLPDVQMLAGRDLSDLVVAEVPLVPERAQELTGLQLSADSSEASAISAEEEWIEVEEEEESDVVGQEELLEGFSGVAGEEIDDDIREVFVEEVAEELEQMQTQLPRWLEKLDDLQVLTPLRRAFHTLKGSGRLVGALALGEFSWKIENLLNRVLDRTIEPSPAVVALVERAVGTVPLFLRALRGEAVARVDLEGMGEVADRLAAGEEAWLAEQPVPARRKARRKVHPHVPTSVVNMPRVEAEAETRAADLAEEAAVKADTAIVPGPLPNVDPILFDILQSEVAAHLATVEEYLAQCASEPLTASEPLLRAAHTLNGAIAMVDIPTLSSVLAPLENYVKRLRSAHLAPPPAGLDALRGTVELTRAVMTALSENSAVFPNSSALAATMKELRDSLPESDPRQLWGSGAEPLPTEDEFDGAAVDETAAEMPPESPAPPSAAQQPFDSVDAEAEAAWIAEFELAAQQLDLAAREDGGDSTAAEPVAAEPVAAEPVAEESVAEEPVAEEPVAEEPVAAEPVAAEPVAAEPVAEEPVAEEPVAEESVAEEPVAEESVAEESVAEESVAEEPVAEESVAEESVAEESVAAEPVAAEPVAAEPVAAESIAASASSVVLPPPLADDPQPDGPLVLPDVDEELLEIFGEEASDILDHSDSILARLHVMPGEHPLIVELQRDLHTIKGGARMAALTPIGDLSHSMESLVEGLADGTIQFDRGVLDSLERGFDRLHDLVQRVSQRQAISSPRNAIARFERLVSGEPLVAPASPISVAESPHAEGAPVAQADAAGAEAAATPPPKVLPPRRLTAMDREEAPHVQQEMVRVRSDLLDSLVNYAGEVSIYRSRLEQQISTFRFNLVELEQTVTRLREQLRKLEIETEAQIIARYQREQLDTLDGAFDPLELDRFSQLQQLSRALSESVSDLVSLQGLLDDHTRQSETLLLQQSRVSSDLQEGLMRTRMVPFDSLVPTLRRTLRQAAQELGKRVDLRVDGAHGEMDRNLLERMKAPFEHMLRNALAHGIESPADRLAAGKPAEGQVAIQVSREATEVVLRISDDGRGMDREAIRAQAIERGLLKPGVDLSDSDLYGFILEPGFSTARELTQLAGRGVGMDVVHNEIKQLGGSLSIESTAGRGTSFTIRLPFTLAVTQAILVRLGESVYAIPMSSVQGVARITAEELERRLSSGDAHLLYGSEEYNIHDLAQLLGVSRTRAALADDVQIPLLLTRSGDQRSAIRIDDVVGSREVVVKSVGPQASSVPGIFGATIMGDGAVVIILDPAPLVRRLVALQAHARDQGVEMVAPVAPEPEVRRKSLVMVVDDSITMRKVTTRVLERADFEVATAKDGLDAVEKLQDLVPDLLLLDIEMPRMDGYELAIYMRNDPRLRQIPIIMITSRTGEKHRQRAAEVGVKRYLGKPYQEDDLLREVHEALETERV